MSTDRRIRYTKHVLKESLLELLKERPIERITVKELCEKADINRSTFYVHYGSPQELLDSIRNELYDEIKATKRDFVDIKSYMHDICQVVYDYRELMSVLLKAGKPETLFDIAALWKDDFMTNMSRLGIVQHRLETAYLYITCGAFACIFTWALGGYREALDVIADEVYRLTMGALNIYSEEEHKNV